MAVLVTGFAVFGFLTLAVYLVPLIYQTIFFRVQNLKKKYRADWALVTGGSSGIGLALTKTLATQGVNVVVAALDDKFMESAKGSLPKEFPAVRFRFAAVNLGASDPAVYMKPLIESTRDIPVSLIFNNAGYILVGIFNLTPIEALTANLNCNNTAPIHITHHFSNRMINEKLRGCICFTSSPGGFMASPMATLYSTTKAFLTNFATSIAPELVVEGIDVCVVHPSPTNTGFYSGAGLMSALKFFQRTAVSPQQIADALFKCVGRTVVADHGYYSVANRLLLKILDYTVMSDLMLIFVRGQADFVNIKKDQLAKIEAKKKSLMKQIFDLVCLAAKVVAVALKPDYAPERDEEFSEIQEIARGTDSQLVAGTSSALTARSSNYPLTDCQISIMLQITNQFENGPTSSGLLSAMKTVLLIYNSCEETPDSQGISAGFIQFTSCSGSILSVCNDYISAYPSAAKFFCIPFLPALQAATGASYCNENGDSTTINMSKYGLGNFCSQWTNAANTDPNFNAIQRENALNNYLGTIMPLVKEYGVTAPALIAQMYDTNVQLGLAGLSQIASAAKYRAKGSPATGLPQMRWLDAFLFARHTYLLQLGGAYANTLYRVKAFHDGIYSTGNLNFANNRAVLAPDGSWTTTSIPITC
ncbi:hypothetical protein HK100_000735 [Physocladia obscura]|uniref:Uncharacterized protein n=1 Tax=Physocladia obscura TaxID=109957 RepID=A0AAD5T8P3_9FUNG|nr:hypothetical protein HK100_000735 [Physocladia obscura]